MAKTQVIFTVLAGCGGSSSAPVIKSAGPPTTTNKEENALPSQL